MSSVFGGLAPEEYDRTYSDWVLLRRIIGYFRPHSRTMVIIAVMIVCWSAARASSPLLVSRGITLLAEYHRISGGSQFPTFTAVMLVVGVLAVQLVAWTCNYVRQLASAQAVGDVVLKLREDVFDAVMKRDMSFYDQHISGKIVSRVTSDTQDFSSTVTLTADLLGQLTVLVAITGILFAVQRELAQLALATVPVVLVVALAFRRLARWASRRSQRIMALVNAMIQETMNGIVVAKNFRQEAAIYADFRQVNQTSYRVRLQRGWIFNLIFPILDILTGISITLVIYFGGQRVMQHAMDAGDWYLFVRSLQLFFFPLISIASFWSQFQQGLSASERVFALIDAEPAMRQQASEPLHPLRGSITFRDLVFRYHSHEVVLDKFSLHIPAGEHIAIVGHTGAGKSSLLRLIARLYEFQEGELLIDGKDIRTFDMAQYRRQVGLVPQTPLLFSGSVAENIRYGKPDASRAEVEAAARMIGGGEWVLDLAEGLETDVGERGSRLSLGQRQLVALARVLLQDPAILLLDEATASVDPFTEAQIQEGLEVVMSGRTSIVVAHRLSTVRSADRIIVLERGRIVESGTHDTLLAQGGYYATLYTTYFRHQSAAYIEQVGNW